MNKKDRFIKTALCLVLAFAMTFAPIVSSYAVMVTAFTGEPAAEAEDNTGDMMDTDIDSGDQPYLDQSEDGNSNDQTITEEELTAQETNADEKHSDQIGDSDDPSAADESAAEAAEEEKNEESEAAEKTEYVWEDGKVRVTAKLEDPDAVPDDAELVATAVKKDSDSYDYDAYMEALNNASDSTYDENNTLLYDVAFIKDGAEIQPASGKVSVTFEFLDKQLASSLGARKASDVSVTHLPLANSVKEQYDTTADATDISADDINVEKVTKSGNELAVSVENEKVVFETSEFSVFAYTVDFEYGEYSFSMPGNGTIKLSEVFEQLHIEKDVKEVEEVTFSDPELVEVKAPSILGSDWTLVSKKAFQTEETLTVVMNDGEKIEIKVTDAQSNGSLTFYDIDGTTVDTTASIGNNYYITAGNGNNIQAVAKVQSPENGISSLTFNGAENLSSCQFTLVQYKGSGELTPEYASQHWWYDPNANLQKPSDFGLYSFDSNPNGNYSFKATKKDAYSVTLNFVNQSATAPVTPGEDPAADITEYSWVKAELKNSEGESVGFIFTPLDTSNSSNTIILDNFKLNSGGTISYASAKASGYYVDNVRIAHSTNSNESINTLAEYNQKIENASEPLTEADFEGYAFVSNQRNNEDKTKATATTITVRVADPTYYYVKVDCGDEALELPANTDLYAKVTVNYSSGKTGYGYAKLDDSKTTDGGKSYVAHVDTWYLDGQIMPREQISGHENKVTVELYGVSKGTPINNPSDLKNKASVDSYIQDHKIVSYPVIPKNYDPTTQSGAPQRTAEKHDGIVDITDIVYLEPYKGKFDGYTLEYILNDYNIVTLCPNETASPSNSGAGAFGDGDFLMENHCMGGVLVRGDILHISGTGVADSHLITKPSVIGGYVPPNGSSFINNRNNPSHNNNDWNGYVGSVNDVIGDNYVNGQWAEDNGRGYTGSKGHTIATDEYIDWDRLQRVILDTSKELAENGETKEYTALSIDVPAGSNIVWNYPENTIVTINIVAADEQGNPITDPNLVPGTVVSNTGSGQYICPKVTMNGNKLNTEEDGSGMSLVWNYPNAEKVSVTNDVTPEFGHVVAPKAFVEVTGGNYSGTMVGNKVRSAGEGHLYPYRGGTLLGFYGDIEFGKKVNNDTPSTVQTYKFVLEELDSPIPTGTENFWDLLQSVENEKGIITFSDVHFTKAGTYYFKVYEKDSGQSGVVTDETKYLLEVPVKAIVDGDTTTLSIDSDNLNIYKIIDEDNLLKTTAEDDYVYAEINKNAVENAEKMTWSEEDESGKIESGTYFYNTVDATSINLDGTKTLEGQDLTKGQFTFEVTDVTEKSPTKGTIVSTGTNDASGNISFERLSYKSNIFDDPELYDIKTDPETGNQYIDFTYNIAEKMPDEATEENDYTVDGIQYDPQVYVVKVKVTAAASGGSMSAVVTEKPDSITFTNKAEETKGKITLTKTGKDKAKLAGAKFDLYRVKTGDETSDVKINTEDLVTDTNGEITVENLEPGTYYFVETEAPEGYVTPTGDAAKTETRTVKAGQAAAQALEVSMTNTEEAKGKITLTKTGKDNAKLAGAKFDLYRVKTGDETSDVKINTEDLVTDTNGEITVENLEPGTYYFVETEAPEGYVTPTGDAAKTETRTVKAGQAAAQTLEVSMKNTEEAKGKITLTKTGKDKAKLAGAKFDLYRVKTGDETSDVKINTEDLVTDTNGEITVENLEPGTYYFVETEAPEGYVTPTGDAAKTETRTVKAGQAAAQALEVSMTNTEEAKGKITLTKTGKDNAKLAGAKFDLYRVKTGDETSDVKINTEDLVTDTNGEITVENLEPGTYYFVETEAPEGYVTPTGDAAKTETKEVAAGQATLEPLEVSMTNTEEGLGQIILTKSDAKNNKKLNGAKFSLYKVASGDGSDTLVKENLTSNVEGVVTADNLKPGTYYFVETEAPKGYVTPTGDAAKTETRTVKAGQAAAQTLEVSMTNTEEAKGKITLTKTGKDKTKLAGAKFDLYRVKTGDETSDVKINTEDLVTDTNGEITVENLEPGTYYFVETEAPKGYVTPTGDAAKTETKKVAAGQATLEPLEVSMTNTEEAKGKITLTKTGKDKTKLAGAKFDLYRVKTGDETSDVKINTEDLVTDANGEITVENLEPGTYYFVETEAPKGYVTPTGDAAKTETKEVAAGQATLEPLAVSMTNTEEAKGEITLTKTGKDNAKLAGAKFDLYKVAEGLLARDTKINKEELVTDANGEITVENLEPGTYYFVETEAPKGYVTPTGDSAKTETKEVAAGQATLEPLEVSMKNTEEAKGKITLTKTGKDKAKLAGAKFDLYRVKTGDETSDVKINTEDLVTDTNGEITVENLEPGTYYFVETEAPKGYVTPTGDAAKTETRTVKAGQAAAQALEVSMKNTEEAKGKITLTKTGKDNAKLAGAKFDLYRVKTGDETSDVKINTEDLVTDTNGEITVENLESGTYYFVETEAPKGYVTPTGDAAKTETKEVAAGQATLEPLEVSMKNTEEAKGKITLTKTGKDNAKLAGAKFDLYKVAEGLLARDTKINKEDLVTDTNGEITVENLEPGTYYFVETEAPEGYVTPTGDAAKTETKEVAAGQATLEPLEVSMTNTEEGLGQIILTKSDAKNNKKLNGAKFSLYKVASGDGSDTLVKENLTSNVEGVVTADNLKPGTYYFVETEAPKGYVTPTGDAAKTETRTVKAGQAAAQTLEVSMTNTEEAKGKITLTKTGKDKTKLAGAKFDLYRVKTGDETSDVKINTEDLVTDTNGEITVENLEPGTYYFVETEAPKGYVTPTGDAAKTETKEVAAGQATLEPLAVSMTNTEEAKGEITLTKTGKDNAKLAGAKFDLYKVAEGLLARDTKINKEELVTDANGEITVENLEPGTYYFVETEAPKGYVTPTGDSAKTETKEVAAGQATLEPLEVSMKNTEEAKGKITLTKTGKDKAKLAGAKFDLYRVKTGDETSDVKINTEDLVTDTNGEITVENLEPGTYYFVETEAPKGYVTPTGDAAKTETRTVKAGQAAAQALEVSMANTYFTKGEAEVMVKKNLVGREWTENDSFTFKIKAVEKPSTVDKQPMPAKTSITITKDDPDYTVSFGKIEFTEEGTYTYNVEETSQDSNGLTCKERTETISFKVVDNDEGELLADGCDLIQTAEITNTYASSGKGEIKVQKVLEGRDWTNGDSFTFTITGKNGAPMPAVHSISITNSDKKHIKSFGEIRFSKAGTYTYIVKESKGSLGGVTYDETEHEVTIKVADNGKGKLVAAEGTKLVQTEVFTNAYRAKEAKGEIKVQKLLQGRAWNDSDQFTFTLSADKGTPMPAETTITIRKSDADNIRSFGEIKFKKAGKYTYTVRETKGNIKGVNYDTKAHKVTIEVVDDGNGHLIAKEGTSLIQTVKITNTTGVKTGDENQILLPMAGMFASMLALLLIVIRRRKSRA